MTQANRRRGFTLLLSMVPLVFVANSCSNDPAPAGGTEFGQGPPPTVTVTLPRERVLPTLQQFTGRLEPVEQVEVRSRVTGFVERVHFDEGSLVKRGALLYTLDSREFAARVAAAEASVADATARLTLAESEAARVSSLIASRAVSQEELDRRLREIETQGAALAAATAALTQAQLDLEFTRVVAPISGRVGRALTTRGNLVSGGNGNATVLTTIVSLDPIFMSFPVDEPTAIKLQGRLSASAESLEAKLVQGRAITVTGELDFLDNRIDRETGTLIARARFANADHRLLPGSFAQVSLEFESPRSRLLVPEKALGVDQSLRILKIVGPDGVVERRVVTTGGKVDGWQIIESGLEANEQVVIEGLQLAVPGSVVSVEQVTPS